MCSMSWVGLNILSYKGTLTRCSTSTYMPHVIVWTSTFPVFLLSHVIPPIDPLAFRDSGDLIAFLLSSPSSCTHHSTVSPPLASFSSTQEAQACLSTTPPAFDAVLLMFCSTCLYALLNILVSFCPRLFIAPFFILLPLSWWQKAVLVSSRCPQFPRQHHLLM